MSYPLTKQQALDKIAELQDYIKGMTKIDELLSDIGNIDPDSILITKTHNRLYIALPVCNMDWTLEAWRIATELHNKSNGELFVNHGSEPKELGNVIEIRSAS